MNRIHVLHAIDGRLRIRVAAIKRDAQRGAECCDAIRQIAGVQNAVPNSVTGSITITYDSTRMNRSALCTELARIVGEIHVPEAPTARASSAPLANAGRQVMQIVLKTAMEAALKHAIYALL